eukprot:CAMPEP_0197825656 /NCGR_PEP_ID=MMETSP1437-20131217/2699_1 /TAXON_ID=49252 ORGANISM="Eucampia antarctica, Strain CCMP1452" /NCGR_SAMPLE_ID=MMETSP1437 /ASSEMBLY_ACC=CAM_ASM_001096 /LENGTH=1070 /DNA_ID=CAMNT_0043425749 /DNA_START=74 /DNA_END=3286 /DNA_ORIENTATION=-
MGETKRKKFHDKDKYYKLAKEQGYRSRAAFKLTQINRKYHFLENAKIVIDLCAAPGGWTQVAARTMPKTDASTIIAVDILPIRAITSNVIRLIGDITTEKCKAQIRGEMQGAKADVVLCDGAPNIGASYDRDAYQQNEIALHSLKCASEHLRKNGTYVTKMYRSSDYNSFLWVAKQFFKSVQAVKPSASRMQSAEIFLVCSEYLAPTKIDPRMLDPQHVFAQVDGAATGGGDASQQLHDSDPTMGVGKMTIFHKSFGMKQRSRSGYDMSRMDSTMRNIGSVDEFIDTSGGIQNQQKDPIAMLTVCTGLSFNCHLCKLKEDKKNEEVPDCNCQFYLHHKSTTSEIKACLADLKVLNKSDFQGLLKWRTKMQDAAKELNKDGSDTEGDGAVKEGDDGDGEKELDSDAEEENIQAQIERMRQRKYREKKKVIKKERALAAKRRRRAALGMDLNALEVPDNDKIFSLATITKKGDLEAAREVDLDKFTADQLFPTEGEDEEDEDGQPNGALATTNSDGEIESQGEDDEVDESTGYSYRLDRELDTAYDKYIADTKNAVAKTGSKMQKRSKKAMRQKAMDQAHEDNEMMSNNSKGVDADTKAYAKLLQGNRDSDDSDSSENEEADDESDDGFNAEPSTPREHQLRKKQKEAEKQQQTDNDKNPLIYTLPEDPASMKTARWFSNPLFESISNNASMATLPDHKKGKVEALSDNDGDDFDSMSEDADEVEQISSDDDKPSKKKFKKNKNRTSGDGGGRDENTLTADSVLAMMPKTDKQIRHEKRKKAAEREQRKLARRAKSAGEPEGGFEVVDAKRDEEDNEKMKLLGMSDSQKKQIMDAKALIKAGFGDVSGDKESSGFEVVSASGSGSLPIMDKRKYDSENEDYDSDDYAQTLALGTMMLRQSKAKALVDASYNRFAWNDPSDLPDWFLDDENRSYRPQLPIPAELLAKMREKFILLSTRPIAKVAEARARKNKRAKCKLVAAKKKAETVANSSELSESMKLKAISKAMRGQDAKRPSKTYVVSKKGGGTMGGKGIQLVDKRMRNDKRSMERSAKKSKGGKKGAMTGGKRRRQHK